MNIYLLLFRYHNRYILIITVDPLAIFENNVIRHTYFRNAYDVTKPLPGESLIIANDSLIHSAFKGHYVHNYLISYQTALVFIGTMAIQQKMTEKEKRAYFYSRI